MFKIPGGLAPVLVVFALFLIAVASVAFVVIKANV